MKIFMKWNLWNENNFNFWSVSVSIYLPFPSSFGEDFFLFMNKMVKNLCCNIKYFIAYSYKQIGYNGFALREAPHCTRRLLSSSLIRVANHLSSDVPVEATLLSFWCKNLPCSLKCSSFWFACEEILSGRLVQLLRMFAIIFPWPSLLNWEALQNWASIELRRNMLFITLNLKNAILALWKHEIVINYISLGAHLFS